MPRTITKEVYKFSELSDGAKEKARDWYREGALDYDWWDSSYDDFATVADILGINLRQKLVELMGGGTRMELSIYFTSFYRQGQGSGFDGSYAYAKGSTKRIREYAPKDETLHRIADDLAAAQRPAFYRLSANIRSDRDASIDVEVFGDGMRASDDQEVAITTALNDFNAWMFTSLRGEYEYLMSDEAVDEAIEANEYEFDEEGNIA